MSGEFARDYAIQACRKPENALDASFFDLHLKVVAFYAVALADTLGADREVVEIASYLHDISAVMDIKTLLTHPINSGDIAEKLLLSEGYPYEKTIKVKQRILRHASPWERDRRGRLPVQRGRDVPNRRSGLLALFHLLRAQAEL